MSNKLEYAYVISDITEFGKLCAFCINNDVSIWRTYWDERVAGNRAYCIDWIQRRCQYCDLNYYREHSDKYVLVKPIFEVNSFGNFVLKDCIP